MSTPAVDHPHQQRGLFHHEAFVYAGEDEFVAGTSTFLRAGREAGEPSLVVVSARKIAMLRAELGADADAIQFADMADVGANPARIIPAWREFVSEHSAPGRALRGIGEPAYPERSPAEMVECHRHEALLNLAFADSAGFRLLCPYDAAALDPEVIAEAHRTHPYVVARGVESASSGYGGLDLAESPFATPLSAAPADADQLWFDTDSMNVVRGLVTHRAAAVGLAARRTQDLILAVNEMATNSVRHGGGSGVLRVWQEDDLLLCEINDEGQIDEPLVGRVRPAAGQIGGFGVWLANQLCDLVQIRTFATGTTIRLHTRIPVRAESAG